MKWTGSSIFIEEIVGEVIYEVAGMANREVEDVGMHRRYGNGGAELKGHCCYQRHG